MRAARRAVSFAPSNLGFVHLDQHEASLLDTVRAGLRATRKALPPRLFYDARGAHLFERICRTQAYYPTRTEIGILRAQAVAIADAVGRSRSVIEPGAGDMRKIRLLLDALRPYAYAPIDVSGEQLLSEAQMLAHEFPWLRVRAIEGDFADARLAQQLDTPTDKLLFFPGSTIGNFTPDEAAAFLARAREIVGPRGKALVGVDLVKDKDVLERAYNDPEGYTAQFNLNLLIRLNRELGTNFDLTAFEHRAFYDTTLRRIEMHLVSRRAQSIRLGNELIRFAAGESIHTESSYKYQPEGFQQLAASAGFAVRERWLDDKRWFGVFLFSGG